ncbi:MAG: hypothetical protein CMD74_00835 [Gammaproteobacteria bacterium]|nr:hypothetical protein [Gammaproteobacteria bacterium]|tara:strand:- start:1995 stop:2456 length:462 start_codon:yes stop_codon:yes gene_type:complete
MRKYHLLVFSLIGGIGMNASFAEYHCGLGAYSNFNNAERALDQLEKNGIDGLSIVSAENGKARFRVVRGPYSSRELADEAKLELLGQGIEGVWVVAAREAPYPEALGLYEDIFNELDEQVSTATELLITPNKELPILVTEPPSDYQLNRLQRE